MVVGTAGQRLATIDVGTNTALLLISEWRDGGLHVCHTSDRFVRLGEGTDASGMVGAAAMERLYKALEAFKVEAAEWNAQPIVVGATSASRDARNAEALVAGVGAHTGLSYEILTGEEEASLSYAGALSVLSPTLDEPVAIVDIGGGSTEVVVGGGGLITYRTSMDIGSVRLAERFFSTQPATGNERARAIEWVDDWLRRAGITEVAWATLIGASGTTTVLSILETGSGEHAPSADGLPAPLPADSVHAWSERLAALTYDEVLALHAWALRGRADVFPAGVLILDRLLHITATDRIAVSTGGLRHGLALRYWNDD